MDQLLKGALFTSLLCTACEPLPGQVVGTYAITMALAENTCGAAAVHPLDGKKYAVELRDDDEAAYWRIPGQTPIRGKYEAPTFRFEYASVVGSSSNDAGSLRCRLVQSEVLSGTIDATREADAGVAFDASAETEEDDASFALEGEHELVISAEPGSDCRDAILPEGSFEKLPCVVRYELTGVPHKPF